jgi:hypothetical protein
VETVHSKHQQKGPTEEGGIGPFTVPDLLLWDKDGVQRRGPAQHGFQSCLCHGQTPCPLLVNSFLLGHKSSLVKSPPAKADDALFSEGS